MTYHKWGQKNCLSLDMIIFLFWFTFIATSLNDDDLLLGCRKKWSYSPTSSSSKPVRSISSTYPMLRTYSRKARWQNTYWSGIWIEKALCARMHSTENIHYQHSSLYTSAVSHLFSWCRLCRCPRTSWLRCPGCRMCLSSLYPHCSAPLWGAPGCDLTRRGT